MRSDNYGIDYDYEHDHDLQDMEEYMKANLPIKLDSFVNIEWDDHEEDMIALSLKFNEVEFCLNCEFATGEFCNKYFLNGKMQKCDGRVVFDNLMPW